MRNEGETRNAKYRFLDIMGSHARKCKVTQSQKANQERKAITGQAAYYQSTVSNSRNGNHCSIETSIRGNYLRISALTWSVWGDSQGVCISCRDKMSCPA